MSEAQGGSESQGSSDQALVVLMRCDEGEPAVPSRVVACNICGDPCWISIASGEACVAEAEATGLPVVIMCMPDMVKHLDGEDEPPEVRIAPATAEEVRKWWAQSRGEMN